MSWIRILSCSFFIGATLLMTGCGPKYPKCENDGHCSEKGEFCVNALCQQCRDNSHCEAEGPGMICQGGKCARKPGYCDDSVPCPDPNGKCRNNVCGPQCVDISECGDGEYCTPAGTCATKPQCGEFADTRDCPQYHECQAGTCVEIPPVCAGDPVYFDFDRYNIKRGEREKIEAIAECMKAERAPAALTVEGHCDERGTAEYNLALGDRRASGVQKFLQRLGVPADKLDKVSYGEERPADPGSNEGSWSKNRRAEFSSK